MLKLRALGPVLPGSVLPQLQGLQRALRPDPSTSHSGRQAVWERSPPQQWLDLPFKGGWLWSAHTHSNYRPEKSNQNE